MLIVSRRHKEFGFAYMYNTETGEEYEFGYTDIVIGKYKIMGVQLDDKGNAVYNPILIRNTRSIKASMLLGLECSITDRGVLCLMYVESNGVPIFLADICNEVDLYALSSVFGVLNLVFDDRLVIINGEVKEVLASKVIIDLRRVTNESLKKKYKDKFVNAKFEIVG